MAVVHAITMAGPGEASVLEWTEVPDPTPGPDEVVVAVRAAGVNRADLSQRAGHYPPPPGASPILGLECSGRIAAVGSDVEGWHAGDDVCALLAGGGYAEQVAVPAGQLLPIPAGVPLIHAAGLPEAACTVWSTVFQAAAARAGETLLVHGGTSGIGTFAIQLAHALGVRVLTTAGTPDKCARALALGAELAIDYRRDDFVAAVHSHTDGVGVDVILDVVGGEYLGRNLRGTRAGRTTRDPRDAARPPSRTRSRPADGQACDCVLGWLTRPAPFSEGGHRGRGPLGSLAARRVGRDRRCRAGGGANAPGCRGAPHDGSRPPRGQDPAHPS